MTWGVRIAADTDEARWNNADDVLDHDAGWLLAQRDQPDKAVLVVEDEAGRNVPFFVYDGQVDFDIGELSVGRSIIRRHVLVGNFDSAITEVEWTAIFGALASQAGPRDAYFLLGVLEQETLERALSRPEVRRHFLVAPHGPLYERRLCALQGSLDGYLASLPSGRRQDLKRSLRRFERQFDSRYAYEVFTEQGEIRGFLEAVEPLSRRTYQARLRGLAITRQGHVATKLAEGARRGYARCYLLRIDGQPVAWRIGYLYKGVYYSHYVGYDPDFDKWHPGVVLHLHSVRDLSDPRVGAHTLDMLYGDNDFKRKAANRSRRERNYYVFPRNVRGRLNFAALSGANRVSKIAGSALERAGVKARVMRWVRRA